MLDLARGAAIVGAAGLGPLGERRVLLELMGRFERDCLRTHGVGVIGGNEGSRSNRTRQPDHRCYRQRRNDRSREGHPGCDD
ncbi:hypothetical protein MPC4_140025 [Methylocella tundrae]|uniref:Uncharacterized protein n=1 Tax=Methylocella tundrae TaxID=227605 RepID=A0A8B6M2Q7_METTU|nr:hypothetical protein MPC1_2770001 [Methylocella tundrae]VTZ49126.1 hypothetical protein MPC4_140025 [Methylocella tundrae]